MYNREEEVFRLFEKKKSSTFCINIKMNHLFTEKTRNIGNFSVHPQNEFYHRGGCSERLKLNSGAYICIILNSILFPS